MSSSLWKKRPHGSDSSGDGKKAEDSCHGSMDVVFVDDGDEVLSDDVEKVGEEDPVLSRAGGNKVVAAGNQIGVSENKIVSGNPSFRKR